jgi:hypothetical protein
LKSNISTYQAKGLKNNIRTYQHIQWLLQIYLEVAAGRARATGEEMARGRARATREETARGRASSVTREENDEGGCEACSGDGEMCSGDDGEA